MKTSELTDAALDWAVAKCEGEIWEGDWYARHTCRFKFGAFGVSNAVCLADGTVYNPSTDWSQGGPIIEREKISINRETLANQWLACPYGTRTARSGPTPLIAAMRCYVTSKLGDTVELPEGLK